jgi:hypothetical protein
MTVMLCSGPRGAEAAAPPAGDPPPPPADEPAGTRPETPAPGSRPAERKAGPALRFDERRHDFGEIQDTAVVTHAFRFVNTSEKTVHPVRPSMCCGMTAAFDKEVYAPGAPGVLTVVFHPLHRGGRIERDISIGARELPGAVAATVTVAGVVVPVVVVEPQAMQVAELRRGETVRRRFLVTGLGADFDVAAVEGCGKFVQAVVGSPQAVVRDGRQFRTVPVEVTVSPEAPLGMLERQLIVRTTNAQYPKAYFLVRAEVVGEFRASPRYAMGQGVKAGEEFTVTTRVVSRDGLPFLITSVDAGAASGPKVETDWRPAVVEGSIGYEITVRGTAPERPGTFGGTLSVATDRAGEEPLRILYRIAVAKK